MKLHIILCDNSESIVQHLEDAGYKICMCCTFKDTIWLSWHPSMPMTIHGLGNGCENECRDMCTKKCLKCNILDNLKYKYTTIMCHTVEDFIKYINLHDIK